MRWIIAKVLFWLTPKRSPDFTIGNTDRPYMHRWFILPRNPVFNIYLHRIMRDDDDRALHDHKSFNLSIILRGGYWEQTKRGIRWWKIGSFVFRSPWKAHRLVVERNHLGEPIECWTLFITGPTLRTWGFHCPKGWVPWTRFIDKRDYGNKGRGC